MPAKSTPRKGKGKLPASKATAKNVKKAAKSTMSFLFYTTVAAAPILVYFAFLALATTAPVQRFMVYSNYFHTLWWPWTDVNKPEQWGFAKNQVIPFNLRTSDNKTLHAWHIMPLPLYSQHEETLVRGPSGLVDDITQTSNFKILREDPNSRLVIYFHGNAGHIAQSHRPTSYHSLTTTSSYHVLTLSYRGFGLSTSSPTESGLLLDAQSAIHWALHVAHIPPSRIVLLGQSLGTAVTAAAAAHNAEQGVDFAGVVLVAGFESLPGMLSEYRLGGVVAPLGPLRMWPWGLEWVLGRVVDTWRSGERVRDMVRNVSGRGGRGRLSFVHAADDRDIPCGEDDKLFEAAVGGMVEGMDENGLRKEKGKRTVVKGENAWVATWKEGDVVVRQEMVPYGGHNNIMAHAAVAQAVMRSFDLIGTGKKPGK